MLRRLAKAASALLAVLTATLAPAAAHAQTPSASSTTADHGCVEIPPNPFAPPGPEYVVIRRNRTRRYVFDAGTGLMVPPGGVVVARVLAAGAPRWVFDPTTGLLLPAFMYDPPAAVRTAAAGVRFMLDPETGLIVPRANGARPRRAAPAPRRALRVDPDTGLIVPNFVGAGPREDAPPATAVSTPRGMRLDPATGLIVPDFGPPGDRARRKP